MGGKLRGRSSMEPDRQVEQRLAMLLRPGPRRALLDSSDPPQVELAADASPGSTGVGPGQVTTDAGDGSVGHGQPQQVPSGAAVEAEQEVQDELRNRPGRRIGLGSRLRLRLGGRFERPQVAVVAAMVVVGLVLSGWAVLRARPVELADLGSGAGPTSPPSGAASTSAATGDIPGPGTPGSARGSPEASPSAPQIKVHVLGAVRRPGVQALPPGSRIEDALAAAGGPKKSADLGDLNLAQLLVDGQQIYVARSGAKTGIRDPDTGSGSVAGSGGGGAAESPSGTSPGATAVDLNQATAEELDQLPGVGPVTAGKILTWREQNGRFSSIEELQEIDGIGPKTYAELAPLVTV